MGQSYRQFDLEERCEIARRRAAGESVRQIAAALDRAPSTVSRELKRNAGHQVGYQPSYAEDQARARRWRGSRLLRDADLQAQVLDRLAAGWSPQQVAGRMARDQGRPVLSHETIYRFIAAQIARTKDYSWRRYLPRGKSKRGFRGRRGGRPTEHIKGRRSIDLRPAAAADRANLGHWEADLMLFGRHGNAILALHERASRLLILRRRPTKAAHPIAAALRACLVPLPQTLRQTLTFDNGTEFAAHHKLGAFGLQTFFCDPHSPWQKGGVENAIGRLRRVLPRNTDFQTLTQAQIHRLARRYNNTPRKCLDFQTPAEVFSKALHFECDSTFPLSPE